MYVERLWDHLYVHRDTARILACKQDSLSSQPVYHHLSPEDGAVSSSVKWHDAMSTVPILGGATDVCITTIGNQQRGLLVTHCSRRYYAVVRPAALDRAWFCRQFPAALSSAYTSSWWNVRNRWTRPPAGGASRRPPPGGFVGRCPPLAVLHLRASRSVRHVSGWESPVGGNRKIRERLRHSEVSLSVDTSRSDTLYTSSNTLSTSSNTVPGLAHLVPVKHIQYKFLHIPYIIIQDIQYQILHIYYNRNALTNSSEKPLICSISTLTRSEFFIVFGTCYVDILNNKPLNTSSKSNSNTGCLNTIYFIIFTKMYFSLKCRCIGCSSCLLPPSASALIVLLMALTFCSLSPSVSALTVPLCECTDSTANGSYFLSTVPLHECTDSTANGSYFLFTVPLRECTDSTANGSYFLFTVPLRECTDSTANGSYFLFTVPLHECTDSTANGLTFCSRSPSVSALIVLLMVLLSVHYPLHECTDSTANGSYFLFTTPLHECTDSTANASYFLLTVPLHECIDSIANGFTFCSLPPSVSALIVLLMVLLSVHCTPPWVHW